MLIILSVTDWVSQIISVLVLQKDENNYASLRYFIKVVIISHLRFVKGAFQNNFSHSSVEYGHFSIHHTKVVCPNMDWLAQEEVS